MKYLKKLLIVTLILSLSFVDGSKLHNEHKETKKFAVLSIALQNISRELFETNHVVRVVKFEHEKDTVVNSILESARRENVPVQVTNIRKGGAVIQAEQSIVTVGTLEQPKDYIYSVVYNDESIRKGFYVHWKNASVDDLLKFKKNEELKKQKYFLIRMEFAYFLIEDEGFIRLLKYGNFPSQDCVRDRIVEVNKFSIESMKWETNEFKLNKFESFHGCNLTTRDSGDLQGNKTKRMLKLPREKMLSRYYALNKKIHEGLAGPLNYKIVASENFLGNDLSCYSHFPNSIDFGTKGLNLFRPILIESVYFAVPVGVQYNGFEKLVLPFDDITWTLISFTIVSAFTTLFFLKFSPTHVRNFVIGRNVNSPYLNVLRAVFGVSQISLPQRNFARFLVMQFLLYCMILRTVWQGKMFEFMQKDMRRPEVKSIEEMIEKNFTFYLKRRKLLGQGRMEIAEKLDANYTPIDEIVGFSNQLSDPYFKGTLEVEDDLLVFHAKATNGTFLNRVLKQQLYVKFVSQTSVSVSMFDTFDKKFQQLVVGGIIDYYDRDYREFTNPKRYEHLHPNGPKVLTMEHLNAGFAVLLVPMTLSILAFIGEWIARFLEFIVIKYTLSTFYQMKICSFKKKIIPRVLKNSPDHKTASSPDQDELECLSVTSKVLNVLLTTTSDICSVPSTI